MLSNLVDKKMSNGESPEEFERKIKEFEKFFHSFEAKDIMSQYEKISKSFNLFESLFKSLLMIWVLKIFVVNIIELPPIITPLGVPISVDFLIFILGTTVTILNIIINLKNIDIVGIFQHEF